MGGSIAPAQASDPAGVTGTQWHQLHPHTCHTVGDYTMM
jgi:hypothetical protein